MSSSGVSLNAFSTTSRLYLAFSSTATRYTVVFSSGLQTNLAELAVFSLRVSVMCAFLSVPNTLVVALSLSETSLY